MDLRGKRILVVGASGELGSRIAALLVEAGATLILTGRTTEGVERRRLDAPTHALDLRDPDAAARLVSRIEQDGAGLDGIVIAAGVVAFGPAMELSPATLSELMVVNASSPMALIRSAGHALHASADAGNSPFVLTLSGVVSEAPTAGLAAYSASKAALAAFMQAASREVRRNGIRLIDARPGHIETGLVNRAIAGGPPAMPSGLDPDRVAARIVAALRDDERDLPSSAFTPPDTPGAAAAASAGSTGAQSA